MQTIEIKNEDHELMNDEDGKAVEALMDKIGDLCNGQHINIVMCAMANLIAGSGFTRGENPLKIIGYLTKTILGAYAENMSNDDETLH